MYMGINSFEEQDSAMMNHFIPVRRGAEQCNSTSFSTKQEPQQQRRQQVGKKSQKQEGKKAD